MMYAERLLFAHLAPGMTWRALARLHEVDPELKEYHTYSAKKLQAVTGGRQRTVERWRQHWQYHSLSAWQDYLKSYHITPLTVACNNYPARLRQMYDPPWVIYCQGNLSLLNSPHMLAVVGTRNPTAYGKTIVQTFIPDVAEARRTVISGLAQGIDTLAHKCTIAAHGSTVAVLAGGLHHIYPRDNTALAMLIAEKHLLISEYRPDLRPQKWHFPERNRIISALGDALFVVEAGERSGTLITVDQALEQGREVLALPGPVLSPVSAGTNRLIQQGAYAVTTPHDLITFTEGVQKVRDLTRCESVQRYHRT